MVTIEVQARMMAVLEAEEDKLAKAHAALLEAEADFEMASRKYEAARDVYEERCGNPYPPEALAGGRGKYRFMGMELKYAIYKALGELDRPVTLNELRDALYSGGFGLDMITFNPHYVDRRALNAALINLADVKTEGRNNDKKFSLEVDQELRGHYEVNRKEWKEAKAISKRTRRSTK